MNIDGIKCLRPNRLPRNLTTSALHGQAQAGMRSTISRRYRTSGSTSLAPSAVLSSLEETNYRKTKPKKSNRHEARGNREPGRQIAQFELTGFELGGGGKLN